jgi:hypothetical protein
VVQIYEDFNNKLRFYCTNALDEKFEIFKLLENEIVFWQKYVTPLGFWTIKAHDFSIIISSLRDCGNGNC